MKNLNTSPSVLFSRRLIITAFLVLSLGVASALRAGPGAQYWESLRSSAQFAGLKTGDKVVYVCLECKTASEMTIESHDQAMGLCKEGASIACPSCKTKTKTVIKRQRTDAPVHEEVVMVNEKGEECAFFAKPGQTNLAQYSKPLHSPAQFESLKAGDKLAYVCNECKTVSEITTGSHDQAMDLCKEGASVSCPSCKMKTKVVVKRERNDPPTRQEIVFVNEKGEECAFLLAKPTGKK